MGNNIYTRKSSSTNIYLFKVNNRNTRAKCEFWTYSTPCFSASIVNFEQVNAGWVVRALDCECEITGWLQARFILSSFQSRSNESQKLFGNKWLKVNCLLTVKTSERLSIVFINFGHILYLFLMYSIHFSEYSVSLFHKVAAAIHSSMDIVFLKEHLQPRIAYVQ